MTQSRQADIDEDDLIPAMNEGLFDMSRLASPSLSPGDAVFFHPHLGHGSEANRSPRRRRLVTMWYVGG